jgi:hypothetical protein
MKGKQFFLLFLSLSFYYCNGQLCTINGKVLDLSTNRPLSKVKVVLYNCFDSSGKRANCRLENTSYVVLDSIITNIEGKFTLNKINAGVYGLYCQYTSKDFKKTYFESDEYLTRYEQLDSIFVTEHHINTYTFHLMVTCPYEKTKNYSNCPRCKTRDKVKPIFFGLPAFSPDGKLRDDKDKIIDESKFYFGGCFVDSWCNPTKHCDRCNKSF